MAMHDSYRVYSHEILLVNHNKLSDGTILFALFCTFYILFYLLYLIQPHELILLVQFTLQEYLHLQQGQQKQPMQLLQFCPDQFKNKIQFLSIKQNCWCDFWTSQAYYISYNRQKRHIKRYQIISRPRILLTRYSVVQEAK